MQQLCNIGIGIQNCKIFLKVIHLNLIPKKCESNYSNFKYGYVPEGNAQIDVLNPDSALPLFSVASETAVP